jgi:plastocyanin domain-containing protein
MSIYTINAGTALTGSVYTIQNFYSVATSSNTPDFNPKTNSVLGTNSQTATINVTNSGYSPQNITLKKDVPVKLNLVTNQVENCSRSFTIPSLNIEKLLPETGTTTIEFTPNKEGLLTFACSMGMYTGKFNIIN